MKERISCKTYAESRKYTIRMGKKASILCPVARGEAVFLFVSKKKPIVMCLNTLQSVRAFLESGFGRASTGFAGRYYLMVNSP